MITPNKFVSLKESVIGRIDVILEELDDRSTVNDLYSATSKTFKNVDEFIYALDVLHILGKIKVNLDSGEISKC